MPNKPVSDISKAWFRRETRTLSCLHVHSFSPLFAVTRKMGKKRLATRQGGSHGRQEILVLSQIYEFYDVTHGEKEEIETTQEFLSLSSSFLLAPPTFQFQSFGFDNVFMNAREYEKLISVSSIDKDG